MFNLCIDIGYINLLKVHFITKFDLQDVINARENRKSALR